MLASLTARLSIQILHNCCRPLVRRTGYRGYGPAESPTAKLIYTETFKLPRCIAKKTVATIVSHDPTPDAQAECPRTVANRLLRFWIQHRCAPRRPSERGASPLDPCALVQQGGAGEVSAEEKQPERQRWGCPCTQMQLRLTRLHVRTERHHYPVFVFVAKWLTLAPPNFNGCSWCGALGGESQEMSGFRAAMLGQLHRI